RVFQLPEDVCRVVDRAVHGRGGEQRRCDEARVVDEPATGPRDLANEVPEPDSHREEVEERLEDARKDHHPGAAVHHQIALEEQATAAPGKRGCGHFRSLSAYVRCAQTKPITTKSRRYAACPRARTTWTSPSVNIRQSSTPCQSGDAKASHSNGNGRRETGKNVPEKRNIGTTMKRLIGTKAASESAVAAYAAKGVVKAAPSRTAAGSARIPSGESTPPNAAITTR